MIFNTDFVSLPVNKVGRDFLVGDLHGQKCLLDRALSLVRFDPSKDRVIAVGDLVDRGADSEALLHLVRDAHWFISARGNHDAMLLESMLDPLTRLIWNYNQNEWSYSRSRAELEELARIVEGLPFCIELPLSDGRTIGVVHAEVKPGLSWNDLRGIANEQGAAIDDLASTMVSSMLWGRRRLRACARVLSRDTPILDDPYPREATWDRLQPVQGIDLVVAGHSVLTQFKPVQVGNFLFIETGAFLPDGRLTIVEIARDRYWQVGHAELSTPVRRRRPRPLPKPKVVPEVWRPRDEIRRAASTTDPDPEFPSSNSDSEFDSDHDA